MDPGHPRARTIRVADGRIVAVSNDETARAAAAEIVVDCRGGTAIPGFIDAHCHLVAYAQGFVSLDLGPRAVSSIADIQRLVGESSRTLAPGSWILGRGYGEFALVENRHPTRWELDAAAPAHPVSLTHHSGYANLLNSMALERLGITSETGDPPDGLIDREVPSGEPTGLVYGMNEVLAGFVSDTQQRQAGEGIRLAGPSLAALGITSLHDASARNDLARRDLFREWQDAGHLPQRVSMVLGWDAFRQWRAHGRTLDDGPVRVTGVKLIVHEITGRLCPAQAELDERVLQIHQAGCAAVLHAIEQRHIEAACTAIENARRTTAGAVTGCGPRHRIEHCSVCPPGLAARLATAGVTVVTQPAFVYHNGARYLRTVPEGEFAHLYALATLLQNGVDVAGSSDFPVVPPDPLLGVYGAVTRRAANGEELLPAEAITPLQALRLFTSGAARAIGAEDIVGAVRPGRLADLVVLSDDPTAVIPDALKDITVETTIIGGRVVWERG